MARNLLCAIACAALVAGCGGGGHKSSTTKSSTTTTASTSAASKTPSAPAPLKLTETVVAPAAKGASLSSSAKAPHGTAVVLRTVLPAALARRPQKLLLTFTKAGASTWKVKATIGHRNSTATVTSADGKPMTLSDLAYLCPAPPSPGFCPIQEQGGKAGGFQLKLTTRVPVTLTAIAGPLPNAPKVPPPSSAVVPTYKVKQEVLAVAPVKPGTKPRPLAFGSTASVHPGDKISMATLVTGGLPGAPQPMTLSFSQGPAKTIAITATIAGGLASTATLTSASGHPIELILPVYRCFVAPAPVVCPPKVVLSPHHYSFTFNVVPTSPIRMQATVQAG